MFDTKAVGKTIRQARMKQNMTQLDLADAMGVSYQAVSNWERGNSMPDISKLEDLCRVLDLTLGSLLGTENQETVTVEKVLAQEPLTVDELTEVAPMIPPKQMQEQMEGLKDAPITIEALTVMAPFLDEETLDALVRKAVISDTKGIKELAVFLSEETLDYVVQHCEDIGDADLLNEIAVFLSEKTLDHLAERAIASGNLAKAAKQAVFMGEETLQKLAKACMAAGDMDTLRKIAVFM